MLTEYKFRWAISTQTETTRNARAEKKEKASNKGE